MRTLIVSIVLLSVFCAVLGQFTAGIKWEGTWSNSKRGSAPFYLCVDRITKTAHGTYGNLGLVTGELWGNNFYGFWYEAGYDRPFGPFELTISSDGSSFTGSWSYYKADLITNGTFTWSGTKSSSTAPDHASQCLFPATLDQSIAGVYNFNNYICDHSQVNWLDSNQPLFQASFQVFGKVEGYSYDIGSSLLLSDFHLSDNSNSNFALKPENGSPKFSFAANSSADNDDSINTQRIVVGRMVSQNMFCGWFWYGLYSQLASTEVICLNRTQAVQPDPAVCSFQQNDVIEENHMYMDRYIPALLKNVQAAFDGIQLPEIYIDVIQGNPPVPKNKNKKLVEGEEYIIVCNSATSVLISFATLLAIALAF